MGKRRRLYEVVLHWNTEGYVVLEAGQVGRPPGAGFTVQYRVDWPGDGARVAEWEEWLSTTGADVFEGIETLLDMEGLKWEERGAVVTPRGGVCVFMFRMGGWNAEA